MDINIVSSILNAAKENPVWGLFVFALTMWYLQWRRNEARDKEYSTLSAKLVEALSGIKESTNTTNLLLQTLLTRRES